jgi:hypothetical protein
MKRLTGREYAEDERFAEYNFKMTEKQSPTVLLLGVKGNIPTNYTPTNYKQQRRGRMKISIRLRLYPRGMNSLQRQGACCV